MPAWTPLAGFVTLDTFTVAQVALIVGLFAWLRQDIRDRTSFAEPPPPGWRTDESKTA